MYGSRKYTYGNTSRYRYPVTATFKRNYHRGSSSTSRALGSARASKSGSKLDYFNCTVCGNITFQRTENTYYSDVCAFYPNIGGVNPTTGIVDDASMGNVYGGLVNDRSFRLKCAQYDEYRIVSMRVKINMANDENGTMTLCTIADRQASRNEVQMDDASMADIDNDVPSFREVCESQGSIKTIINKNRITPVTRTIYARDMKEKIDFTDCTIEYDNTPESSPLTSITMAEYPQFSPAIYFCIQFSEASTSPKNFTFGYTVEYNCIFRNPKSDIQTFIIKEDPSYKNPAGRSANTMRGITYIPSGDPYIPDMELKNGKETNISWLNRYKARIALKNAKKLPTSTDTKPLLTTTTLVKKEDEETSKTSSTPLLIVATKDSDEEDLEKTIMDLDDDDKTTA